MSSRPLERLSPEWWLAKLERELLARQAPMKLLDDYYRGAHPLPFVTKAHEKKLFSEFRRMLERTPREKSPRRRIVATARELARRYEHGERWIFELWLECLAYAARHPEFASLPATFWRGNRALMGKALEGAYAEGGQKPPIEVKHLASAMTALDIGLAIQNLVDPQEVPLELYPQLYELLFAPLLPEGAAAD